MLDINDDTLSCPGELQTRLSMKCANEGVCHIPREATEDLVAGSHFLGYPGFGAGNASFTPAA
jgi:hypothetical protein